MRLIRHVFVSFENPLVLNNSLKVVSALFLNFWNLSIDGSTVHEVNLSSTFSQHIIKSVKHIFASKYITIIEMLIQYIVLIVKRLKIHFHLEMKKISKFWRHVEFKLIVRENFVVYVKLGFCWRMIIWVTDLSKGKNYKRKISNIASSFILSRGN